MEPPQKRAAAVYIRADSAPRAESAVERILLNVNLTAVWLTERGEPRGGDRVTLCRTHDCCGALRFARLRRRGRRRMVYALEAGCGQTTTKAERLAAASTLAISPASLPICTRSASWRGVASELDASVAVDSGLHGREEGGCSGGAGLGGRHGWLHDFREFGDEFWRVVTWWCTDTNQRIW